jgi:hypothetical protein
MREVIKGFFHQIPFNKQLSIINIGPRNWEIRTNWYRARRIVKHLQDSYPTYKFTLKEVTRP